MFEQRDTLIAVVAASVTIAGLLLIIMPRWYDAIRRYGRLADRLLVRQNDSTLSTTWKDKVRLEMAMLAWFVAWLISPPSLLLASSVVATLAITTLNGWADLFIPTIWVFIGLVWAIPLLGLIYIVELANQPAGEPQDSVTTTATDS